MTKKHFEKFAAMLRGIADKKTRLLFAEQLVKVFKEENERFNETIFRKAADCGT